MSPGSSKHALRLALCTLPYRLCALGSYPVERHYESSWISNTNCKWLQPWETATSFLIFFIIYQKEPFILDDRERIWYVLRQMPSLTLNAKLLFFSAGDSEPEEWTDYGVMK